MRNQLYLAREVKTTERGSRVAILQDGPSSFHITVQNGNNIVYEHFQNPPSLEELHNNINTLENSALITTDFCSNDEHTEKYGT